MCSLWAFFPVGDTKSQPFAAIIEANRMFPKAFQDVAMLLRQLLPNPLPLRPCPHMGQTQEQENKSGLTLAKSSTFYIDCFTPYTCDPPSEDNKDPDWPASTRVVRGDAEVTRSQMQLRSLEEPGVTMHTCHLRSTQEQKQGDCCKLKPG